MMKTEPEILAHFGNPRCSQRARRSTVVACASPTAPVLAVPPGMMRKICETKNMGEFMVILG